MRLTTLCLTTVLCAAPVPGANAQEKPSSKPPATAATTPLTVQVVMTRYEGEKKLNSLAYTLLASATEPDARPAPKSMMMGVQVPLTVQVKEAPTVAFKDVGSRVTCTATSLGAGRYKLALDIEVSTIADDAGRRTGGSVIAGPVLRTFRDSVEVVLRDGQTTQTSSATDPVSGEVLKVEVTLTVPK